MRQTTLNRSVHRGINPTQKHYPLLFAKPRLNLQTLHVPPFLGNPTIYIVFCETRLVVRLFNGHPKYQSFSFLTPSHLLKLVSAIFYIFFCLTNDSPSKTMRNVFYFIYKLFLILRYSYFCIFIFNSFFPCQPLL